MSVNIEHRINDKEFCNLYNVSNITSWRYRHEGKLPFITIGGKVYYTQSDIDAFEQNMRKTPVKRSQSPNMPWRKLKGTHRRIGARRAEVRRSRIAMNTKKSD